MFWDILGHFGPFLVIFGHSSEARKMENDLKLGQRGPTISRQIILGKMSKKCKNTKNSNTTFWVFGPILVGNPGNMYVFSGSFQEKLAFLVISCRFCSPLKTPPDPNTSEMGHKDRKTARKHQESMFSKMIPEGFCTCFGPFWAIFVHALAIFGHVLEARNRENDLK